jgi:hypothetical protein
MVDERPNLDDATQRAIRKYESDGAWLQLIADETRGLERSESSEIRRVGRIMLRLLEAIEDQGKINELLIDVLSKSLEANRPVRIQLLERFVSIGG